LEESIVADCINIPTDKTLIPKPNKTRKIGGLKKVTYAEDTIDVKPSTTQSRRGKVLQSETVFFVE